MHADIVDQLFRDQGLPFMRTVEELAHRNGRCAILPNLPEVTQILRRERILEEKHPELLSLLAKLHRFVRSQPFMHVMDQLHFVAQFAAANFKKLQRAPHLGRGIKQRLVVERLVADR